jgi:uncharacterized repeat protein (TIGR03943 family)
VVALSRRTQGTLLAVLGLIAFRLVITGSYDSYVKAGMRLPLLAASAFLVAVGGGSAFVAAWRADRQEGIEGDHEHTPWIAWVLVLPLGVLLLVAPNPLGADAASRQDPYTPTYQGTEFGPLPPARDGAVPLALGEFVNRALWGTGNSLDGTTVRLTGFVVRDVSIADGFVLTRFTISCCAADAVPVEVGITGLPDIPPDDQWVDVTGQLIPVPALDPDDTSLPRIDLAVEDIILVDEPAHPYE